MSVRKNINFLFIVADDLGWSDLSCYGSKYYETPNIDALAANGIKFTDAYAAAPVCSATRASILSGWSPARQHLVDVTPHLRDENYSAGFTDYPDWQSEAEYPVPEPHMRVIPAKQLGQFPTTRKNFAHYLAKKNYARGYFGKWHLGPDKDKFPDAHGFENNIGGNHFGWPPTYFSPYRNAQLADGNKDEYLTDRLAEEAGNFIDSCCRENKNFLCYLPHYAVHGPFEGKPEYVKHFEEKRTDKEHQCNPVYAAMIKSLDDSIGQLINRLKKNNILENTMIIFFSDNGGLGYPHGKFRKDEFAGYDIVTDPAPLRGFKASLYEGGIRVPLIISFPGEVNPAVSHIPVISHDFLPTILDYAGIKADENIPIDGTNLRAVLSGGTLERDFLTWFYPWDSWLEAYDLEDYLGAGAAIRKGDYKLIHLFEGKNKLYNLRKDIGEKNDLAAKMPKLVNELYTLLINDLINQNAHFPKLNEDFNVEEKRRYLDQIKKQKGIMTEFEK